MEIPVSAIETASSPVEPRTEHNIIENLENPLDDENFNMGVSRNFQEIRSTILQKSAEADSKYVWTDKAFIASEESLHFSTRVPVKWADVEWKRPSRISKNPRLLKQGASTGDILQGSLGDCWWLSSVAAIARNPKYMERLIPKDQALSGDNYVGMLNFRFWRFGDWVDVIVDDKLPTVNGHLVMGHSADEDEFWLPLMEKAYSKLHGSYQAIEGGFSQDALEDLTGGMAVSFDLGSKTPEDFFKSLVKAMKNGSFACCSIKGSSEGVNKSTGLVSAHAYTITGARKITFKGASTKLIRIRNPWGNEVEWKGKWSDNSSVWDDVESSIRRSLRYEDKDDGEWWMEYKDFIHFFTSATICTMGPDFDCDGAPTGDEWYLSKAKGAWLKKSAGGSLNDPNSFSNNPQYFIHLDKPDSGSGDDGKCSIIIGLMQGYRRLGKKDGLENLHLGIHVYKLEDKPDGRLPTDHFRYNRHLSFSDKYINKREVSITAELDPGYYVIIPSTFYKGKSAQFLLRIFTEKHIDLEELV